VSAAECDENGPHEPNLNNNNLHDEHRPGDDALWGGSSDPQAELPLSLSQAEAWLAERNSAPQCLRKSWNWPKQGGLDFKAS